MAADENPPQQGSSAGIITGMQLSLAPESAVAIAGSLGTSMSDDTDTFSDSGSSEDDHDEHECIFHENRNASVLPFHNVKNGGHKLVKVDRNDCFCKFPLDFVYSSESDSDPCDNIDDNETENQGQLCEQNAPSRRVDIDDGNVNNVFMEINPIFIPSIIYHISSFLPCGDLKRCRFLNKQWNEECSKFLRHKGVIKLTSKSKIVHYTSTFRKKANFSSSFYFENIKGNHVDRFLSTFGLNIKYLKYDFSKPAGNNLSAEEFYNLIFKKLPNLQELSLVGCVKETDHFLPQQYRIVNSSISDITSNNEEKTEKSTVDSDSQVLLPHPTLPLIKKLEIYLYNTQGQNVSQHEFLIELLRCVPNLETISVPKVPRMLAFGMPLLHTLLTTENLQFRKLQQLDMDVALYNGSIDVLKSKGYPLQYLNAEVNSTVSDESLHSLLESYGTTLVTLQLKFASSPVASADFSSAPNFQALRHLTLHGYKGSLAFLECLHLETFVLIDNSFNIPMDRTDFLKPLDAQFNYKMVWTNWVEETYVFDLLYSSDAQVLLKFSRNFPNLRSLNLPHLNDQDMRIIYSTFSHSIQDLTMENTTCTDYGLTGIEEQLFENNGHNSAETCQQRTQPFIGDLKRLRKLEIILSENNVTDFSITNGIMWCENLNVLIIRNALITNTGLKTLVDSMFLEHLETTMCNNIRGGTVKYALEKMKIRGMSFTWNKYQDRIAPSCVARILAGNSAVTSIVP